MRLADVSQQAGVAAWVRQGVRALKAADVLDNPALRRLYGLSETMVDNLKKLAEKKGVTISIRPRSPKSLAWLDDPHYAMLKPEHLKIKTVNEVDTKFLGYDVSDEASLVFKDVKATIPDEAALRSRFDEIKALDPDVTEDMYPYIKKRWEKRAQEWDDNLAQYQKFEEKGSRPGSTCPRTASTGHRPSRSGASRCAEAGQARRVRGVDDRRRRRAASRHRRRGRARHPQGRREPPHGRRTSRHLRESRRGRRDPARRDDDLDQGRRVLPRRKGRALQ
ncbi:MAG: hypothetical protein M5U31_09775 [Acidimicrobiia bacterium]|nr:hypothetical protein [Acidimicrobiia bacterium]